MLRGVDVLSVAEPVGVSLLARPLPEFAESSLGYLLRLSSLNGLDSPTWLGRLTTDSSLSSVASHETNAFLRGPIANFPAFHGPDPGGISLRHWNTRRPRFCPDCLATKVLWKASWDLNLYTACPIHKSQLLEQCPVCGEFLSWRRRSLSECSCGASLSEHYAPVASHATIALAGELENRLLQSSAAVGTLFPVLEHLGMEELLNLVFFLGAYAVSPASKPLKVPRLAELGVARSIAENGATALLDWPHSFAAFLDGIVDRYRRIDTPDARLKHRYGYFYRAFQIEFNAPAYEFLHEAFEAHLRSTWKGQLARRHRTLSNETRALHDWIPLRQAGKLLGASNKTVQRYLERGLLVGQTYRTAAGRIFGSVSRASIANLVETRKHWLTLKDVRARLGISRKAAESLLRDGGITPISGPSVDGSTVWMFDARTLPKGIDSDS